MPWPSTIVVFVSASTQESRSATARKRAKLLLNSPMMPSTHCATKLHGLVRQIYMMLAWCVIKWAVAIHLPPAPKPAGKLDELGEL